jgi:hypothetical protein
MAGNMEYNEIKERLSTHPSLLILRDRQAPLILGFFAYAFRENRMGVISREELQLSLAVYLEDLEWNDEENEQDYLLLSGKMLDSWCSEKKRYMRRYTNDQGGIVHELTSYSEKTLRWLEDLAPKEFVGAESRFSDIYKRLKDLVEGSQVNPEKRLAQLMEKRNGINREIRELKEHGEFQVYEDWQIRERFEDLSRSARDLLSDFKLVEDNFKQITRRLFESEMDRQMNRGTMLQLTLDALDGMKNTPQGKSFSVFWRFLMADFGRDEINTLVSSVYELVRENEDLREDAFLRELKYYLHQAGMKILDIKSTILKLGERIPEGQEFMHTGTSPEINLPMERPLSLPKEEIRFEEPKEGDPGETDFSILFDPWFVDPLVIRKNIKKALGDKPSVRLSEILKLYPPEKGLGEVMAYRKIESTGRKRISPCAMA